MIANLITLPDFKGVVPFSTNIGEHLVAPHIADAQEIDFWPLLPAALRTDLAQVRPWVAALETLWADHLKRLLVLAAARRLLLWHGLHITPNGAENTAALPITDTQRTQLRADLAAKSTHYQPLALAAIHVAYPTTATTCGDGHRRRRTNGGFSSAAL
jgi:hypothetical protein